MTGTQIFIILMSIIAILALGLVGLCVYFLQYKKKVHRQAQQNQIYLCKKMEVIVKMLAIIADPQRDRNTTIIECNKLANEVIGSSVQAQQEIIEQQQKDDTSNKELISQIISVIKEMKK